MPKRASCHHFMRALRCSEVSSGAVAVVDGADCAHTDNARRFDVSRISSVVLTGNLRFGKDEKTAAADGVKENVGVAAHDVTQKEV